MANNRLYLGDSLTKEYIFIEKGWGAGWDGSWFDCELFYEFISTRYDEGEVGQSTNMFFFTEFDDKFSDIISNWNKFELQNKVKQKELLIEIMRSDEELGLYKDKTYKECQECGKLKMAGIQCKNAVTGQCDIDSKYLKEK